MAAIHQRPNLPTAAELASFLQTQLPPKTNDVAFVYHKPFTRSYDASKFWISSVVLSVTPTRGFYTSLQHGAKLGFLHRPFGLDRRSIPRLGTVLSSHKAFDEVLTVGANFALCGRLNLESSKSAIIQGYKGDPERRIGLVAPFKDGNLDSRTAKLRVLNAFKNQVEGSFGFEDETLQTVETVAIMNAFHPEEVDRAVETAQRLGLLANPEDQSGLLYLTGAVREPGLTYAREKGIKVICVGHRVCEEWGIGYLADQIRDRFPAVRVEEIYEEEGPQEPERLPEPDATRATAS